MFWLAVVFAVVAVVALGTGLKGVGLAAAVFAQVLFLTFVVWTVTSLFSESGARRPHPQP